MGGNNESAGISDGKQAAVDLVRATRPEDFTKQCYGIDQKLTSTNSEYARSFMAAMNTELQDRNLLPKVELNMIAASNNPTMQALQHNKHVETQDLVNAENQLVGSGRITEAMLTHQLSSNAPAIHDTHAERNFWGKNHGGINLDRINRWADQNPADLRGALADIQDVGSKPNDRYDSRQHGDRNNFSAKDDPRATEYDKSQDANIQRLNREVAEEKKAREESDKANHLKAKVEAGVIKDAHHSVQHGETLYDMACLALHKAGRDHMTPNAIKFEEEKIRALNHLGKHEQLHSGQSLMLRTPQEVEHETARRIRLSEQASKHSENSSQTDENAPVRNYLWAPGHFRNNNSREYSPVPRLERLSYDSESTTLDNQGY